MHARTRQHPEAAGTTFGLLHAGGQNQLRPPMSAWAVGSTAHAGAGVSLVAALGYFN